MSDGAELISIERQRQIQKEGWTPEHDDEHEDGSLAMAAVCYATPVRVFERTMNYDAQIVFEDPWPSSWDGDWDKRAVYGEDGELPDPATYTASERIDLLTKAGALIAAEIDRLLRQREGLD